MDWTTEFGQTIDMHYMGSSHVSFMYFECYRSDRKTPQILTLEPHYLKVCARVVQDDIITH